MSRPPLGLAVFGLIFLGLVLSPTVAAADHDEADHSENIRLVNQVPFGYGTDMAFQDNTLVAGAGFWDDATQSGIHIFQTGNPLEPKHMSFSACAAWHSDVGIWGNLVVQSHDDDGSNLNCAPGEGNEGVRVFDVSQKQNPTSIGFAETIHGSHNLTVVGDTGLVYVSSYNLGDPSDVDGVSIVDIGADPVNPPVRFLEFPDADATPEHPDMENRSGLVPASPGCHDIGLDLERNRAFCAGITETHVWDISDPRNPAIISIIYNPAINIHHGAQVDQTGNTLILNDEWLGAAGGPSGCLVSGAPTGALWFYDITDPTSPQPLSFWSPPTPEPTADFCTSHFFGTFPDRQWLVSSWYDHGLYVVDFTDPTNPQMLANYDPGDATFWSAYPHKGYLYANSFSPATLIGSDPTTADLGGLWIFEIDGYTRADK